MEIHINYLAVLVVGIIQMVIGMVWYGRYLFGKRWMEFTDMAGKNEAEIKAMQKAAGPLYGLQFLLALLSTFILAHFIQGGWASAPVIAFTLWLGFIMPIQAGGVMWDKGTRKMKRDKFLIMTCYQLVCILVAAWLLAMWK